MSVFDESILRISSMEELFRLRDFFPVGCLFHWSPRVEEKIPIGTFVVYMDS